VQIDQRLQRRRGLRVRGRDPARALNHRRRRPVAERLEQRLLAREVPVHTWAADARSRPDVVDPDGVIALRREQVRGRLQQQLTPGPRARRGRHPGYVSVRSHRSRRPAIAADVRPLLDDLRDEQADLRAIVDTADLDLPTPAEGWDVRDSVSHLAGTDVEATLAMTDPEAFVAKLPMVGADIDGFLTKQLTDRRDLERAEFLQRWQLGFEDLLAAFDKVDPATKLPWYGPPMSPASFATARLMEYWAHGQDVADAVGVARTPTARLRHICHLGHRTRGFSYVNRGRRPPDGDVRLELTAPDGTSWTYGGDDATDSVTGSALDFALLVTQRRHRDDVELEARGAAADEWLSIAQCFAGPPGPGRAKR
jgi:uncharacterized protein (TIGR03084 family)